MNFFESYEHLEKGGFITKKGWGDSFLWMKQKAFVKSEYCKDPILKSIADASGGVIEAEQTICKYDSQNKKIITGFVPQQEDMASDEWFDVEPKLLTNNKPKSGYVGDLFDGADVFKKPFNI